MPGAGGRRAKAKQPKKPKGKGKRVSGNPAKRAAQQKQGAQQQSEPAESPFGLPAGAGKKSDAEDFELPKELRDLL